MITKILIVEDEESILMGLEDDLKEEGYQITSCKNGIEGFKEAQNENIDLILLDIMLPGMDGMSICRELRKRNVLTPIIMLTAKSQEVDKILGLEFGADDYITKPFSLRELQARIKAVLRRSKNSKSPNTLILDSLTLDKNRNEASIRGVPLNFTYLEFSLLFFLAENEGKVIDRYRILEEVWNNDVMVSTRTIDTHIANLRKKIDHPDQDKSWIQGIRGVGYKLIRPKINSI